MWNRPEMDGVFRKGGLVRQRCLNTERRFFRVCIGISVIACRYWLRERWYTFSAGGFQCAVLP